MAVAGPLDDEIKEVSQDIGAILNSVIPKGWGFALLMFQTNTTAGRMNYICNADRTDMLAALKELVGNMERENDAARTREGNQGA